MREMKRSTSSLSRSNLESGQTMMEYIIIVALLAVASIAVTTVLGNVFRDRVMHSADAMVGHTGGYQDQGREAIQQGQNHIKRGMDNFDQ